eukprot:TRINITY_DN26578_c0_g1_i1.p1 TRINITY_DN26578_c0_g1~~TRINITY_DN26578_c0_g1_i1.p1  ORF type:complete len:439 (-),score=88.01 TRINITY_DN26578_c0_g1_i1:120-1436(-)
MPIDVKVLRERPEDVRESQRRRFKDPCIVDEALKADVEWRAEETALSRLRAELAVAQKHISEKKKRSKGKDPCTEEIAQKQRLDDEITAAEGRAAAACDCRTIKLGALGNLVHDDVPVASSEENNVTLRCWGRGGGEPSSTAAGHWEVLKRIGAFDAERGVRVAGRRGYFLRGPGVLLNMALQNYGLAFLARRGYEPLQPPFTMRRDAMARTAELRDFDEQLYSVTNRKGDGSTAAEAAYLIATSEQPISAFHQDESLDVSRLPIKYAGVSPCFRAETGSHGQDAKGLFRVHQFEKVEQFCISSPEASWGLFEEMMRTSEEFYKSLGLSYRVVAIASGGLNDAASMKYDLEGWFPAAGDYKELVSCSNCTDFQARALGVRLAEGSGSPYAHMLNATLCATERTMCCLAEQCQEAEGIRVPAALAPYMLGQEFLPFLNP